MYAEAKSFLPIVLFALCQEKTVGKSDAAMVQWTWLVVYLELPGNINYRIAWQLELVAAAPVRHDWWH